MKYVVSVTRIGYACSDFVVEAENVQEAQNLALEAAANHLFSEHSSEYEVSGVDSKE
jgi:hypothetical protein